MINFKFGSGKIITVLSFELGYGRSSILLLFGHLCLRIILDDLKCLLVLLLQRLNFGLVMLGLALHLAS